MVDVDIQYCVVAEGVVGEGDVDGGGEVFVYGSEGVL